MIETENGQNTGKINKTKEFLKANRVVLLVAVVGLSLVGGLTLMYKSKFNQTLDDTEVSSQIQPPKAQKQENSVVDVSTFLDRKYAKTIRRKTPLVLSGNQTMRIKDTRYIIASDITLRDKAKLIIDGSAIEHRKQRNLQYELVAKGNSQVIVKDSVIGNQCNGSLNWNFFNNSKLTTKNVAQKDCNIWHFFTNKAAADIYNQSFSGTFCDRSKSKINKGFKMELELCYNEGAKVDESLPENIDSFSFPNKNDKNVTFKLNIKDSTMDGWGVSVPPNSNVTFRDSSAITVSIIVGLPLQNQTVVLDGLDAKLYKDKTWKIAGSKLRLINSKTYGWEPNVFCCNNTLVIKNSNYTGNNNNSSNGHYIIRNSTLDSVLTQEEVTMEVYNSVIKSDVIATQDSRITLTNTKVKGRLIKEDNGRIITN